MSVVVRSGVPDTQVIVSDPTERDEVSVAPPIGPVGMLGANLYDGGWPPRPRGFALVVWVGPTQPDPAAGQLVGDLFIPNTF